MQRQSFKQGLSEGGKEDCLRVDLSAAAARLQLNATQFWRYRGASDEACKEVRSQLLCICFQDWNSFKASPVCWWRVNQQRVDGSFKCVVKWETDNAEQWLLRPRESTADSEAAFARNFRDKLEHISQPGPSGTESKVCSQNTVVFTSPSENTNTCFALTQYVVLYQDW